MKNLRFLSVVLVAGLLLVAVVVVAQSPNQIAEPPLRSAPADGAPAGSSQPLNSADQAPADSVAAPPPGERSSLPLLPDGSPASPAAPAAPAAPEQVDAALATIADFRITGTALKPRGSDVDYVPTAGGGCFYASAGNTSRVFNTGVYLPQGSLVRGMRFYYDDTSGSDSTAWFSVYDLYGDLVQEWSVTSAGTTGNGFNDTTLISHTIDYSLYSYAINWRSYVLGSTMQNCGFRIFYEPPHLAVALPMIQRNYP